jgi:DNA-binding response OmpR family regulator
MSNEIVFQQLGLTKSEAKVAYAIYEMNGKLASVDYLLNKLYSSSMIKDMKKVIHDHKQNSLVLSGTRTLRVFISKIRRKLNIDIGSEYNGGYYFPESSFKRLNALLGSETTQPLESLPLS